MKILYFYIYYIFVQYLSTTVAASCVNKAKLIHGKKSGLNKALGCEIYSDSDCTNLIRPLEINEEIKQNVQSVSLRVFKNFARRVRWSLTGPERGPIF